MDERDDEINSQNSGSIFEDTGMTEPAGLSEIPPDKFDYSQFENSSPMIKFFNTLSDFLLSTKEERENKKLQKQFDEFMSENEDLFVLLNSFGCKLIFNGDVTEFVCERYNLTGNVYREADNTLKFDDNAKLILKYIAREVYFAENLDASLDEYEENGFYPVGSPAEIEINGKKFTVGTLRNKNGDEIKIDMKTGKKIIDKNED